VTSPGIGARGDNLGVSPRGGFNKRFRVVVVLKKITKSAKK